MALLAAAQAPGPYRSMPLTITNGDYSFTGLPSGFGTNYFYVVSMAPPYDYLYMTTTNGSTTARSVTNVVNLSGYTVSARQVLDIRPVTTNIDFAFTYAFAYDWGDLPVSYGTMVSEMGKTVKAHTGHTAPKGTHFHTNDAPAAKMTKLDGFADGIA